MSIRAMLMLIVSCSVCFADISFVLTTKDKSPVYLNYTRALFEEPIFNADRNEIFQVIAEKGEKYNVIDEKGRSGWIEKGFCVKTQAGKRFEFESADVNGYIDVPGFAIIIDKGKIDEIPLRLERSFRDELRENIDKEKIKRVTNN
jgi:hypothetical protein